MPRKKDHKKHGFTLAELLIVVAILGVLVAISIPKIAIKIPYAILTSTKGANITESQIGACPYYSEEYGRIYTDSWQSHIDPGFWPNQ